MMEQMMGDMVSRHDSMMESAFRGFDDPFFSGGIGGMDMLGGSPFAMLGGRDRGQRGGGRGRGDEMDMLGGSMMHLGGMSGGNGAMYTSSSVMSSDGQGNTYRRSQEHKQVGNVSESKFHEADSRAQREAIGLRRGLGQRSRAVTRTRHAGGDEEVHNVLNGVGESDARAFDSEWQQQATGGVLQDRGGYREERQPVEGLARYGGPRHRQAALPASRQRQQQILLAHGGSRPSSRGRINDIAPQGDMFGHYGAAARGGGGGGAAAAHMDSHRGGVRGGGSGAPDRFVRATPVNNARSGGGGGGSARRQAPSHRLMAPQAD